MKGAALGGGPSVRNPGSAADTPGARGSAPGSALAVLRPARGVRSKSKVKKLKPLEEYAKVTGTVRAPPRALAPPRFSCFLAAVALP